MKNSNLYPHELTSKTSLWVHENNYIPSKISIEIPKDFTSADRHKVKKEKNVKKIRKHESNYYKDEREIIAKSPEMLSDLENQPYFVVCQKISFDYF